MAHVNARVRLWQPEGLTSYCAISYSWAQSTTLFKANDRYQSVPVRDSVSSLLFNFASWITLSKRSLTGDELKDALSRSCETTVEGLLDSEQNKWASRSLVEHTITHYLDLLTASEAGLTGSCADMDLKQELIDMLSASLGETVWKALGHEMIASTCIKTFIASFQDIATSLSVQAERLVLPHETYESTLLEYSKASWHYHCQYAESQDQRLPRYIHEMLQISFCLEKGHEHTRCNDISSVDLDRALCFAIKYDFTWLGRTYIEMGADINCRSASHGETALHIAVAYNSVNTVKFLIQHGAGLTAVDGMGFNALHWAAYFGHTVAAKHLIDAGVDVNAHRKVADFRTDLYEDLSIPLLESFLETADSVYNNMAGGCIFRILDFGSCHSFTSNIWKPLSIAMEEGNSNMQQLLVRSGAYTDCNLTVYDQNNPGEADHRDDAAHIKSLFWQRSIRGSHFQRESAHHQGCKLRRSSRLRTMRSQEENQKPAQELHVRERLRLNRTQSLENKDRIEKTRSSNKYCAKYCLSKRESSKGLNA